MDEYSQVRCWIENLPKMGKTTFSLIEVEAYFSDKSASSVRRVLARLADAGKICSIWKGFYAITLPEYGLSGAIPPMDYIDQLMRHLGKKYYVALLTAASLHGASHQAPQRFYVICGGVLHRKSKNGFSVEPVYKKAMSEKYISAINSRTAEVKVSTPELTALDLVTYMHRVGGINNVASVLAELAETMDYSKTDVDIFDGGARASVQRLGYLLDEVLGERKIAESLYGKAELAKMKFKAVPLVSGGGEGAGAGAGVSAGAEPLPFARKNKKWNIIINYEVESDI